MALLLLLISQGGRLADTACSRRCHASIKSRQTSPTGDERQNKRKSGPSSADSLKASQLAAGRDHLPPVGRHRQGELEQQASKQKRRGSAVSGRVCGCYTARHRPSECQDLAAGERARKAVASDWVAKRRGPDNSRERRAPVLVAFDDAASAPDPDHLRV